MEENFNEKKTNNFNYEVINDGDAVRISGSDIDTLIEKACDVYFGLDGSEPMDFLKKEIIEDLKSGETLRPCYGSFGISLNLKKKELLIMNQNARGYQPNRDLMKKVIGY